MKFEIEPLVAEMLNQLPDSVWSSKTSTFFDPAIGGGQFVRAIEQRLRECGHSDANIRSRVFGFEVSELHIRFAVNKYRLVGQYAKMPYSKFFELDDSMKFDVVVGNPPYQSSKGNSDQLWPLFTEKAISLTKNNGHTAFIIPDTWTSGTKSVMISGRQNLLTDVFSKLCIKMISFDIKKYFPGIGSGFSAFLLQKSLPINNTTIISPAEQFTFDIKDLKYIPKDISLITLNIVKKVTTHLLPCVYFKFYGKTDGLTLVDTKDKSHSFVYSNTSSNHPTQWGNIKGQGYGKKKVIYAYMGSKQKFEYDLIGDVSLMHNGRGFEIDTPATEEGLVSYFESKIVKFLNKDKWSQYNEPKILNLLPIVDFTKVWTDKQLYKHFGLTQEEIDYVETNVK
jgi:site-specific DNA-methyltransferase (adenine-specific)